MPSKKSKIEKSPFDKLITKKKLKELAGETYYQRGESYFKADHVENLTDFDDRITAIVWGRERYSVKFWINWDDLEYSCSCPLGDEGEFCKHCVCTGLEWFEKRKRMKKNSENLITEMDIFSSLLEQDKEHLAKIIVDQTRWNTSLRRMMTLETSVFMRSKIDIDLFKQEIRSAVNSLDYEYDSEQNKVFLEHLHEIVDFIEELYSQGYKKEMVAIGDYFLDAISENQTIELYENGVIGGLYDRLHDLLE